MSKANDMNTLLALHKRALTQAADRAAYGDVLVGQGLAEHGMRHGMVNSRPRQAAWFAGADFSPTTAAVAAGNNAPLAGMVATLGVKYGLTPIPLPIQHLAFQALPHITQVATKSLGFSAASAKNIVPLIFQQPATVTTSSNDLVTQAQNIINSFPPDGSDWTSYAAWTLSTAGQIPGLVSNINGAVQTIQSGNASGDVALLMSLVSKLTPLIAKAAANSVPPQQTSSDQGSLGF